MPKAINLTGQRFGRLIVIERDYDYAKHNNIKNPQNAFWKCICDCGNYTTVASNNLRKSNGVRSCGCLRREIGKRSIKNLVGQRFGKLVVIEITNKRVCERVVWKCQCDCGSVIEVSADALVKGNSHSCGCIRSIGEENIARILSENNIRFEREKKFDDLLSDNNYQMRYDFYLPDHNRLIEFDGIQHFKQQENSVWIKGNSSLPEIQKRDNIKNHYAISKGIFLVRIPYWERDNITLELLLGNKYEVL